MPADHTSTLEEMRGASLPLAKHSGGRYQYVPASEWSVCGCGCGEKLDNIVIIARTAWIGTESLK